MSKPNSPYYYKDGSDTYHWETTCSKNNYSDASKEWHKTSTVPNGKEECDECKHKK